MRTPCRCDTIDAMRSPLPSAALVAATLAGMAATAYAGGGEPGRFAQSAGAEGGQRVSLQLRLSPGAPRSASVCGRRRRTTFVSAGRRATARTTVRRGPAARTPRHRPAFAGTAEQRGAVITFRFRRCGSGAARARVLGKPRLARGRGSRTVRLPTRRSGDYRITVELRRRGARRVLARSSAYLRVVGARSTPPPIVEQPVRFTVRNVNRSRLACPSDGSEYTVAGRLVAPRAALGVPAPAVTLYLHEFGWGRFFWQFPAKGFDYARALAEKGHASVVLDRLGYDESSRPPGSDTCLGSQADIAHQIVEQLRSGGYSAASPGPVRFKRVAVGGHSAGGAIAELAAYSFGGIDALVLFAYADQGFTMRSIQEANEQGLTCATGGEPAEPGGPGGYAFFAQTGEEWKSFMFASAEPVIADRAAALRNRDPCGDTGSLTPAVVANNSGVPEIAVPALLLYGTSDAIYEQPSAGEGQRDLFSGSDDVTLRFFENTGHALTVERSAPTVRNVVAEWLSARGL